MTTLIPVTNLRTVPGIERIGRGSGIKNPSVREFIHFSGRGRVHDPVIGGPKEIADRLEQWFVERACDGFVVSATHVPGAYEDFVRFVVPELQRRGLFRKEFAGTTLRENLGLPVPPVSAWRKAGTTRGARKSAVRRALRCERRWRTQR